MYINNLVSSNIGIERKFEKRKMEICPECGKSKVITTGSEVFCKGCGLVIRETYM